MKKLLVQAGAAALAVAAVIAPAHAMTFMSELEYRNISGTPTKTPGLSYGTVTLEDQADGKSVLVTVQLNNGAKFLNTGGPYDPFVFNLTNDLSVSLSDMSADAGFKAGVTPFDADAGGYDATPGSGSYNFASTPFGNYTNKIGCCLAFEHHDAVPAKYNSKGKLIQAAIPASDDWKELTGGANATSTSTLVFTVSSANAFSFAGINPTVVDGLLVETGSGDHFKSNSDGFQIGDKPGGWWFAADILDVNGAYGEKGSTFNVAARDALTSVAAVPEASTWAMMLVGFGGVGLSIRSRRRRQTPVVAA